MMVATVIVMLIVVRVVMLMMVMAVAGTHPLDVMVVARLGQADFGLEAQHLSAVFAELAVH
jgi:hypothetical protein